LTDHVVFIIRSKLTKPDLRNQDDLARMATAFRSKRSANLNSFLLAANPTCAPISRIELRTTLFELVAECRMRSRKPSAISLSRWREAMQD
jgi:hypothetical protein